MRIVVLVLFALLIAPTPVWPSDSPPGVTAGDRSAIRAVIESQIAAFRRDDAAEAFSYASPAIQQKFGNPDTFMTMVKQGYRPVYRPREVSFGELVAAGGRLVQHVYVVGRDGNLVLARYIMSRQPDGTWRIGGCILSMPAGGTA